MATNFETIFCSASEKFLQHKESIINLANIQIDVDNSNKTQTYVRDASKSLFKLVKYRQQDVKNNKLQLFRCRMEFSLNKTSQKLLIRVLGNTTNDDNVSNQVVIVLHDQGTHNLSKSEFNDAANALFSRIRKHLIVLSLSALTESSNLLDFIPSKYTPKYTKATAKPAKKQELIIAEPLPSNQDQVTSNNLKRTVLSFLAQHKPDVDSKFYKEHGKKLLRGQANSLLFKIFNGFDRESQEITNKVVLQLYNSNVPSQFSHSQVQKLINIHC